MKKIYIYPNPQKATCLDASLTALRYLAAQGVAIAVSADVASIEGFIGLDTDYSDADYAVVFGGDGTMLRCAHQLIGLNIPLLGVNYGRLGYLTEVSPDALIPALDKLLSGNCRIEKRPMLEALFFSGDTFDKAHRILAINDLCLYRGSLPGMIRYAAYINDTYMDTYSADGALVATPNGSTAYNFSVGGPIVNPQSPNMIFTPICSHSLLARSIVLSEGDVLRLEAASDSELRTPTLSVDGIELPLMSGKDSYRLEIRLANEYFPLIRVTDRNFYDILREKMSR